MKEAPDWLKFLESSPAGAEVVARAKNTEAAESFLRVYHAGLQRIITAWKKGDIDDQYLFLVFSDIFDLLRHATDKTTPLIYRQRTTVEASIEFPQASNPDAGRNFPIAVSA